LAKQRLEERAKESQEIALERIRQAAQEVKDAIQRGEELDVDDDNVDDEEEYKAWQAREIARIKRDKDERDALIREREDTEARRNMSDAQIRAENPERFARDNSKMNFMQKFYHKGAFFQEELDKVAKQKGWDWKAATGEDHVDKKILPSVMQVKNFGLKGRTKYTHLGDQDTTDKNALWTQDEKLKNKYLSKLGGVHHGGGVATESSSSSSSSSKKRQRDYD
jgi:microfibrillar-associated protein 1